MTSRALAGFALAAVVAACASGPSNRLPTFTSLYITGEDLRGTGVETAYDVVANHRELLVFGDEIAFRGGNNLAGDNQTYHRPLLIVDGNRDVGDVTTTLRHIPVEEIQLLKLVYASDVPPEDRRPEATGGVIEIVTREPSDRSR